MARIGELLATLLRRRTPDGDPLSDAVLLDRFARGCDPAAFELLVWRHGPMVLAACRRVLKDAHSAEDAFQAAFLVLARKAGSVRGSAAGWLHRVALRVCLRMKRRLSAVSLESDPSASPSADPVEAAEQSAILDEEVARLPEYLRVPVVVCYLQGHTTERAAEVLGIPRGTVLSRLATARKRLAVRLTARGVAPVVAAVTAPELPADTGRTVAEVAVGFAAGQPFHTVPVQLALEVLAMTTRRTVLAGLACGLAAAGAGVGLAAADPPKKPTDAPKTPPPDKPKADEKPEELTAEEVMKRHDEALSTGKKSLPTDKPVVVTCKVKSTTPYNPNTNMILVSDARLPNHDYFAVILSQQAQADLTRLGISDIEKHFREKRLTVKGELQAQFFTGVPLQWQVSILVDSLDQIRAVVEEKK